ncbi:MAG: class F sortase [Caldilineaceae bacterium]|nr:class F sortase [Caldilineaceae bacterium]
MKTAHLHSLPLLFLAALIAGFVLTACRPDATPTPSVQVLPTTTPGVRAAQEVTAITSLSQEQSLPPTELIFPAHEITLTVAPMGWQVVIQGTERTTVWAVPEEAVGWFVTSAGAGSAGTTILSGYQAQGERVFAPLARGDIKAGEEIYLTDADGLKFVYRISEISKQFPLVGPAPRRLHSLKPMWHRATSRGWC